MQGFQFLPIDKTAFLTIQYLLNLIASNFPAAILHCALMYGGKLIWSSIPQDLMYLLYNLEQARHSPHGCTHARLHARIRSHLAVAAPCVVTV